MKGMVDYIVYACNGIDALIETEKWELLKIEMDMKIAELKRNILSKQFAITLKQINLKLSSIMNFFDEAIMRGQDGFDVIRQRLDSLFVYMDQIFILIQDSNGVLYEKAHYCLDFVASFLIFHLGMLNIAENDYDLKDYAPVK